MNKKKKPAQKSTTEVKKAAATETKGTTESKQKAAAPRVLDGVVPAKKPKKRFNRADYWIAGDLCGGGVCVDAVDGW